MKQPSSALCMCQPWPQIPTASRFLSSIRHGNSNVCLPGVKENNMFTCLSVMLKQPHCSYQVSHSKVEKKDGIKELKLRKILMPEYSTKSFACFIEHQKMYTVE